MTKKTILFSIGIFGVLLTAVYGEFEENALWGLMLLPFFFIGEPWYNSLKRKQPQTKP